MKKLLLCILFMCCAAIAFSQNKPRLGILPFTGGIGGEGETIADLFSDYIQKEFTLIPHTDVINALRAEQNFQLSGYTDDDTIVRIGREIAADYVISGHIRCLGNTDIIIINMVNVGTFEQIAGDYRPYRNTGELRSLLSEISKKITADSRQDTEWLPKLAVATFNIADTGLSMQDADTLAQILAVEIINTGKYAVLTRTAAMQDALRVLKDQQQGYTAEEEAKALGQAGNAGYVLAAGVRRLQNENIFTARILNVEEGSQIAGNNIDYRIVDDGIRLMAELALRLTDPENAEKRIADRSRKLSRAARFADPTKFWSIGVSVGTTFADPWLIGTVRGTIAPFRYSFLELGFDAGFISSVEGVSYYSLYPFINAAFFLPFARFAGMYIGIGGGFMSAEYSLDAYTESKRIPAMNFTAGLNFWNFFDISYTLRTDFKSASNKLALGFSYRFKE